MIYLKDRFEIDAGFHDAANMAIEVGNQPQRVKSASKPGYTKRSADQIHGEQSPNFAAASGEDNYLKQYMRPLTED